MNISELVNYIHSGDLILKEDEVHIWYGCNTPAYRYMEMMRRIISDYELNKAYKFFFSRDRERFIIIRAVLRILISKYQNIGLNEIRYMKNNFGKPYIILPKGHAPLKFNISHSNSAFIIAFTRNREIGVDIEKQRSDFPAENIARLFFSRNEIDELLQMQGRQLIKAFFDCWTKKEAYIKAKGMGLSIDLNSFDVSVAAGKPAQLIAFRNNCEESEKWEVYDLQTLNGYSAALVIEKGSKRARILNMGNVLSNLLIQNN